MDSSLVSQLTDWIASTVKKAGRKGAVIGMSGGIDSSVVAVLCKKALGDNVLGVIMPCESSNRDEEDAIRVAAGFDIMTLTMRLDDAYRALLRALPEGPSLARANLKPRLRMLTLYYLANTHRYLVAGTGNKSEIMTGYFTKYGDGAVDFLPIGGLYKTEVWELGRELGIPKEIIAKAPSAGLWENQTDEGELGISYGALDEVLMAIETGKMENVNMEILTKVRSMIVCRVHKCSPPAMFEVPR